MEKLTIKEINEIINAPSPIKPVRLIKKRCMACGAYFEKGKAIEHIESERHKNKKL